MLRRQRNDRDQIRLEHRTGLVYCRRRGLVDSGNAGLVRYCGMENQMNQANQDASEHMAARITNKDEKIKQAFLLLLEARDALPAISLASAKLHGLDLTLDKRIEEWLEPCRS